MPDEVRFHGYLRNIHGRRALALCISARHRLPKAGRFSLPLVRSILARPRKRDVPSAVRSIIMNRVLFEKRR